MYSSLLPLFELHRDYSPSSIDVLLPFPFAFTAVLTEDTAVYPMYEILGWYTVGTEATELDLRIQRQVSTLSTLSTINTCVQQYLEPRLLGTCSRCVRMYRYARGANTPSC